MSEPVRWVLFVASCLVVPFALLGVWTLLDWRGELAAWVLAALSLGGTVALLRGLYGRHRGTDAGGR